MNYRIQPPPTASDIPVDLFLDYDAEDGEPVVRAKMPDGKVYALVSFTRDGRYCLYYDIPADIGFDVDDEGTLRSAADPLPLATEVK